MGAHYVGLDVHSRDSVFVIQNEAGAILRRGVVPTTPAGLVQLCHDHQLPARTTLALETGTSASYVARLLAALHLGLALRGRTPAERLCELRIAPEPVQQL